MSEGSGPGLAAQPSAPQELPERRWSGGSGVYTALVAGAATASLCSCYGLGRRRSGGAKFVGMHKREMFEIACNFNKIS